MKYGVNRADPAWRCGFVRHKGPIHEEGFFEPSGDGAGATEMCILHTAFFRKRDEMMITDVHAAGEGHSVAGQHLAMRAKVEAEHGRPQTRGQEHGHLNTAFFQFFPRLAQGVEKPAHTVDDKAHVHAAFGGTAQSVGKVATCSVAFKNVCRQADPPGGCVDSFEHSGISFFSVHQ